MKQQIYFLTALRQQRLMLILCWFTDMAFRAGVVGCCITPTGLALTDCWQCFECARQKTRLYGDQAQLF